MSRQHSRPCGFSVGRVSIIECGVRVLVYQRKDWINSDGKTVKPHNHEEIPGYARKAKKIGREKTKDVRTSEGPMYE
jgi:hypothetical protein